MLSVGERAPEFTLPDQSGQDWSLTQLLRGRALLLYFYPADFTPGCTREACALRDLDAEISRVGLRIVGVSPQAPERHAKFRAQYSLPFTLLADEEKVVIKMYGVDGPLGIGVRRATFLVDANRRILAAVRADFAIGKHIAFARAAIALRESMR